MAKPPWPYSSVGRRPSGRTSWRWSRASAPGAVGRAVELLLGRHVIMHRAECPRPDFRTRPSPARPRSARPGQLPRGQLVAVHQRRRDEVRPADPDLVAALEPGRNPRDGAEPGRGSVVTGSAGAAASRPAGRGHTLTLATAWRALTATTASAVSRKPSRTASDSATTSRQPADPGSAGSATTTLEAGRVQVGVQPQQPVVLNPPQVSASTPSWIGRSRPSPCRSATYRSLRGAVPSEPPTTSQRPSRRRRPVVLGLVAPVAEDELVLGRIGAEGVAPDAPVEAVLALRHLVGSEPAAVENSRPCGSQASGQQRVRSIGPSTTSPVATSMTGGFLVAPVASQ